MTNRLIGESSPYLLQHADNPVEWFPWNEEALQLAKELDRPILLSVGYAACHWCHVMAHESFEDPETASLMNEYFVNIKVDREERPDIDRIYMNAVVALTGQGGWPMTVALTPDGEPFFGGTYFPPAPRHGLPSFKQVLMSLADAWTNRRDQVDESAAGIAEHLDSSVAVRSDDSQIEMTDLESAVAGIRESFDKVYGGFGQAPKFPQPMILEFLLRYHLMTGEKEPLFMVERSLEMMARGGIFDQLGGGFARYSIDKYWLAPHFEKMLYDNALLARIYLHAWKATKRPFYRRVVEATLDWILAEMRDEDGGFHSSLDADSEGVEGKFYVWSSNEIDDLLGEDAALFKRLFDVTEGGNWEGVNILNGPRQLDDDELDLEQALRVISESKIKLAAARSTRIRPGLDDKVLTSWNGLALAAFAEAGRYFENETYVQAAVSNAEFLYDNLRQPDGRLLRSWKRGYGAKIRGFLEDYSYLADGLLALYQSTFDEKWFSWSRELVDIMQSRFFDSESAGFFDTPDDHEQLIQRPRETQDNAVPSGNAMAVTVLQQLYLYTGEGKYWDQAAESISSMKALMTRYPLGFGQWLGAAAVALGEPIEVAIVADVESAETADFLKIIKSKYRPAVAVAVGDDNSVIPLLQGRTRLQNKATAYVCRRMICELPVTTAADFQKQIDPQSPVDSNE